MFKVPVSVFLSSDFFLTFTVTKQVPQEQEAIINEIRRCTAWFQVDEPLREKRGPFADEKQGQEEHKKLT